MGDDCLQAAVCDAGGLFPPKVCFALFLFEVFELGIAILSMLFLKHSHLPDDLSEML